jgi:hypothetical protein
MDMSVTFRKPRRGMALGVLRPLGFNALLGSALAGLPPARDFFTASAYGSEGGIVAGLQSSGHGLQLFDVGVEGALRAHPGGGAALR